MDAGPEGFRQYKQKLSENIDQNNPLLSHLIAERIRNISNPQDKLKALELVEFMYRLLEIEAQAERDMETLSQQDITEE